MHETLQAIKREFDNVEQSLVEQAACGRVNDWVGYKSLVARIAELRDSRERAMKAVRLSLGLQQEEVENGKG